MLADGVDERQAHKQHQLLSAFRFCKAWSRRTHRLMPAFPAGKHFALAKHRCRRHFLRGSISLWRSIDVVGISCGEAFRFGEASTLSAFHKVKHFALAKHCHRDSMVTKTTWRRRPHRLSRHCHKDRMAQTAASAEPALSHNGGQHRQCRHRGNITHGINNCR